MARWCRSLGATATEKKLTHAQKLAPNERRLYCAAAASHTGAFLLVAPRFPHMPTRFAVSG